MTDVPPKLVPTIDAAEMQAEASGDREARREAERSALVADTHQREATLLEDTQSLFVHLSAYLRGELSGTVHYHPRKSRNKICEISFCFC